jgi:hypothetical protein
MGFFELEAVRCAMTRSPHRAGARFRRAREQMHAMYGTLCVHCGHDGAGEADHITPISVDPEQPIDPELMRPSHGSNYPCPVCPGKAGKGRACNQERGIKPIDSVFKPSMTW